MSKFQPSDWTPMGGLAIKTRDPHEAARIYVDLDGLTGKRTEGRHQGVDWMTLDRFRAKVIEQAAR